MTKIAIIGNQGFSLLNFRGALIGELCARGHEVTTYASDMPFDIQERLSALGAAAQQIDMARTGLNPFMDLVCLFKLQRTLRQQRPDVVIAYAAKPVIYGTTAAWMAGVPRRFAMIEGLGYIFVERPTPMLKRQVLRTAVETLYRFALKRAQKVLFLNKDDVADFLAMRLVNPASVTLIGGIGVDLEKWAPFPHVTDPVTFTIVSRLLRDKGILEFVEAARRTKVRAPTVRFIVVGGVDSNPESISTSEIEGWVQEGIIEWTGHTDVVPHLKATSVFVLPSYREGLPRSTQEAMAMARAVITTDVPGCRETVVDGKNGFVVQPRDPVALSEAMMRFIDNPQLIVEMGRESRRLAEVRFDERDANQRIIEALGL